MKKVLVIYLFTTVSLFAEEWAGFAGSFLRLGVTARSIAMGGALTAEKDHGFAAYYNPAWIAFLTNKQVGLSYSSMSLDRRHSAISFASPLPPTAGLGIAWVSAGVTDIQGRNSAGEKTTIMQTGEDALMFTFAQRIFPWFSFGANIKILQNQLPINESYKGTGVGFDIGVLFKSGNSTTFGLMIQDINSMYNWNSGDLYAEDARQYQEYFPTIVRAGAKFNFKSILVVVDGGIITNSWSKLRTDNNADQNIDNDNFVAILPRLGIEYTYLDMYYFRAGIGNGRIAFGWGMEYDLFNNNDSKIDYTFSMDWASQISHTLSYGFNF